MDWIARATRSPPLSHRCLLLFSCVAGKGTTGALPLLFLPHTTSSGCGGNDTLHLVFWLVKGCLFLVKARGYGRDVRLTDPMIGPQLLWVAIPLLVALAGFGALIWDLKRRQLLSPAPEVLERFSIESIAQLDARVQRVELSQGGILETVHAELEDARAERRSAKAVKAGETRKRPKDALSPPNGPDLDSLSEEEQLATVEANLGLRPPAGSA